MGVNPADLGVGYNPMISTEPPQAPPVDRKKVVALLCGYWDEAEKLGKGVRTQTDKIVESYNHVLPRKVRQSKAVQTKAHLGWINRAVKAFKARLAPLLMPSMDDFFKLYDQGQTYAASCSIMGPLLATLFELGNLSGEFRQALFTIALEGAVGGDITWDAFKEGGTGKPAFRILTLNPRDVGVFPVTEPPERCVTGIRTYLTKRELLAQAKADPTDSYDMESILALPNDKDVFSKTAPRNGSYGDTNFDKRMGREVKDFYCPVLVVDDQVYERVYATIVDNKDLIRFYSVDPSVPPCSPPVFATLDQLYVENLGPVRIGVGICHGAYDLEMQAITLNNLNVDNAKDNVKPARTYDVADPYFPRDKTSFVPGELIPSISTNPNHLKPLMDSARVMPAIQEQISVLMYQFESAVGIPNFLSGTADTDDRRVSATAKRLEANGADTRIREYGETINDQYLRKMVEKAYDMVRIRLNNELAQFVQDVQMYQQTGQPPQVNRYPLMAMAKDICGDDFGSWLKAQQQIPPLQAITLDLSTFESALEKVDDVNNCERALGTLGQVYQIAPELVAEINAPGLIRNYMFSLNLASSLHPITQAEEARAQAEQQQQQMQQMQQQMQQMQLQLEMLRAQGELTKTKAEIEEIEATTQYKQLENIQLTQLIQQGPPPLPTKSEQQVRVQ